MILEVFSRIYSYPWYVVLTVAISLLSFTLVIWVPNLGLIGEIVSSPTVTVFGKVVFILSLYGSLLTNFTIFTGTYIILLSILLGVNISLLVFYVRLARRGGGTGAKIKLTGAGGFIAGLLGIGCAACGSILLTPILASIGAGALLVWLPLHGGELGIIGVVLLLYSAYLMTKKIAEPLVCEIDSAPSAV